MGNVPIRNIEVSVFEEMQAAVPSSSRPVRTYYEGANAVAGRVSNITGTVTYASYEKHSQALWFDSYKVTEYPTIVFVDVETSRQIARLVGSEITASNVSSIILSLDTIQRDDSGNYYHADGRPALFNGDGNGFGLFSLPPWLLALGTAFAGYKTVNANTKLGQAAYGTLTAVWGLKYLQEQADHNSAPVPIGKTTDTLPIKPGSRAQRHWLREGMKERDFTGRKKQLRRVGIP